MINKGNSKLCKPKVNVFYYKYGPAHPFIPDFIIPATKRKFRSPKYDHIILTYTMNSVRVIIKI